MRVFFIFAFSSQGGPRRLYIFDKKSEIANMTKMSAAGPTMLPKSHHFHCFSGTRSKVCDSLFQDELETASATSKPNRMKKRAAIAGFTPGAQPSTPPNKASNMETQLYQNNEKTINAQIQEAMFAKITFPGS